MGAADAQPRYAVAMSVFAGRRILLVEDSPVVAPFTADLVAELGCTVIGPAPNIASARSLIDAERLDAALLDVHIRGERVFPMCELLDRKGVPFALTSGYADWQVPAKWSDRPRLQKPYKIEDVEAVLSEMLAD